MVRRIDSIIDFIAEHNYLTAVDKIILIKRIATPPTPEEIEEASKEFSRGRDDREN